MNPLQRALKHIERKIEARIESLVLRALLHAVSDGSGFQGAKVEALGDVFDKLELMQPGGVTHVPIKGAEGLLVCPLGRRNLAVVVLASNRAMRPKDLAPGETGLWTAVAGADGGLRVHCKANGEVWIGSQDPDDTDFVAKATTTDARLAALEEALNTLVLPVAGASAGPPSPVPFPDPPESVASTHLKGS
jgi:phage gp45-like